MGTALFCPFVGLLSAYNNSIGFNGVLSAKEAEETAKTECSFKDMWQARFPGAYYHTIDGSNISQGAWDRNDFPVEKFFQNDTDKSVQNWAPTGAEPAATSSQVQSRWNSALGQKSIIVPPELEEKMKNHPELAKRVMANVENFITTYSAASARPSRIYANSEGKNCIEPWIKSVYIIISAHLIIHCIWAIITE